VVINPHANRRVDTSRPGLIRVHVLDSPSFDAQKINPASVTLDGTHAAAAIDQSASHSRRAEETFLFEASNVPISPGKSIANVSGNLTDGTTFTTMTRVFNRDRGLSSLTPGLSPKNATPEPLPLRILGASNAWINPDYKVAITPTPPTSKPNRVNIILSPQPSSTGATSTGPSTARHTPTVKIPASTGSSVTVGQALSGKLQASLNAFVRQEGAVVLNSATIVSGPLQGSTVPQSLKGIQSPYIRQVVATSSNPTTPTTNSAL
jgi:hypothetical protein